MYTQERIHAKCTFLYNVFGGEDQGAILLNNLSSVLIVVITFIIWLLISELTTTSVLVLIATPVLAVSFTFGDTCKTLFQGLVFIYAIRPFNVGDQCIIDGKQVTSVLLYMIYKYYDPVL